ncbi:hypothetical protein GQ53DRAFT_706046 [Thozetella sp. PMI_491]|nr:hypothetical protein GQ53DRAFT_706046 [Thozetella sp. PMI_491]
MDPVSIAASLLTVVTAAIQSIKSLHDAVERYKGRDTTLGNLLAQLNDLMNVLASLKEAVDTDNSLLELLEGPVERCSQLCNQFEAAMKEYVDKPNKRLIDWARMDFKRGNIDGFVRELANYKSTITIALGTISMKHTRATQKFLDQYEDMIKDTMYQFELNIQRLDDTIAARPPDTTGISPTHVDLKDEKAVTEQCIRICQDANSYLEIVQKQRLLVPDEASGEAADVVEIQFKAQTVANQALSESRQKFTETITLLQDRLNHFLSIEGPEREEQRTALQQDINISKDCITICKEAENQVSTKKIHIIGEVAGEDDSDLVVLTTVADLFEVKVVRARNRGGYLVGSMDAESLKHLATNRYQHYNLRFGSVSGDSERTLSREFTSSSDSKGLGSNTKRPNQKKKENQPIEPETDAGKPSANEMRRRAADNGN